MVKKKLSARCRISHETAPAGINGDRLNVVAVVKRTKGNKYKVHRILTPAGRGFALNKKANAVPTTAGGITDIAKASGEVNPAINTASKNNIRQTAEDSQEKASEKASKKREGDQLNLLLRPRAFGGIRAKTFPKTVYAGLTGKSSGKYWKEPAARPAAIGPRRAAHGGGHGPKGQKPVMGSGEIRKTRSFFR